MTVAQPRSTPESSSRELARNPWLILSAAWVLPVILAAAQEVARGQLGEGQPVGWLEAVGRQIPFWAPLIGLAPMLLAFVRRFPFDRRRWARDSLVHLGVILLAGLLFLVLSAFMALPLEGRALSAKNVANAVAAMSIRTLHFHLFMVGAVLAAIYAIENNRRLREREVHASRLRGQLAEAQLATLSAQLQPHFLFNTLHSISSLVEEDAKAAQEMIAALSDLLRHGLQGDKRQLISLEQELVTIDLYLQIEKIRFQDRLREDRQVSKEALATPVPSLLLQPLVENAIRHGIARRQDSGLLEIRGNVHEGRLMLEVLDDGAGLGDWEREGRLEGVGLSNTRRRLAGLYGGRASLTLTVRPPHGSRAMVSIPVDTEGMQE